MEIVECKYITYIKNTQENINMIDLTKIECKCKKCLKYSNEIKNINNNRNNNKIICEINKIFINELRNI